VDEIGGFEHGWAFYKSARPYLAEAVALAKKHGAIIVAESVGRYVRNRNFHRKSMAPTVADIEALMEFVDGVKLATINHPDEKVEFVRGYESSRGQEAKGMRGGRPRKKRPGYVKKRGEEKLPRVRFLAWLGESFRSIQQQTGVNFNTARRWIIEHGPL
jgi:hypothetical protein